MFRIWLTNFQYFLDFAADTLDAAIEKAKTTSFECSIYEGDNLVASWSPIGGLRRY